MQFDVASSDPSTYMSTISLSDPTKPQTATPSSNQLLQPTHSDPKRAGFKQTEQSTRSDTAISSTPSCNQTNVMPPSSSASSAGPSGSAQQSQTPAPTTLPSQARPNTSNNQRRRQRARQKAQARASEASSASSVEPLSLSAILGHDDNYVEPWMSPPPGMPEVSDPYAIPPRTPELEDTMDLDTPMATYSSGSGFSAAPGSSAYETTFNASQNSPFYSQMPQVQTSLGQPSPSQASQFQIYSTQAPVAQMSPIPISATQTMWPSFLQSSTLPSESFPFQMGAEPYQTQMLQMHMAPFQASSSHQFPPSASDTFALPFQEYSYQTTQAGASLQQATTYPSLQYQEAHQQLQGYQRQYQPRNPYQPPAHQMSPPSQNGTLSNEFQQFQPQAGQDASSPVSQSYQQQGSQGQPSQSFTFQTQKPTTSQPEATAPVSVSDKEDNTQLIGTTQKPQEQKEKSLGLTNKSGTPTRPPFDGPLPFSIPPFSRSTYDIVVPRNPPGMIKVLIPGFAVWDPISSSHVASDPSRVDPQLAVYAANDTRAMARSRDELARTGYRYTVKLGKHLLKGKKKIQPISPKPSPQTLSITYSPISPRIEFMGRVRQRIRESSKSCLQRSIEDRENFPLADVGDGMDPDCWRTRPEEPKQLTETEANVLLAQYFDTAMPACRFLFRIQVEETLKDLYEGKNLLRQTRDGQNRAAVLYYVLAIGELACPIRSGCR